MTFDSARVLHSLAQMWQCWASFLVIATEMYNERLLSLSGIYDDFLYLPYIGKFLEMKNIPILEILLASMHELFYT